MLQIITFPSDFATNTMQIASVIATPFTPVITLVLGVVLALLGVGFLIGLLHHR